MKADTFAKLVVLEALIEAEIGYFLELSPPSPTLFREGMVSRVSDLVDDIDVLDSVAAARVYDSIVDFLAELPDDDEGVVDATLKFQRAVDRIVERGMDRRDLAAPSTWAIVLEELLSELANEYHLAITADGEIRPREYTRVGVLLGRARQAADRMLWSADDMPRDVLDEMDRLTYAVRHRRLKPTEVDYSIRSLRRSAAKYRPSTLTRIGAFVIRQLMNREPRRRTGNGSRKSRKARRDPGAPRRAS
jgi:hypothetical protein